MGHSRHGCQIFDGLQDVGDAHTSCFRGQGALEGSSGFFNCLGNLLSIVPCAKIDAAWDNNSESLKGSCRSPHPQTNEKLGFGQLETDRRGRLDHFFTQLLAWGGVSFQDLSILLCFQCARSTCAFQCGSPTNSPRWTRFLARSALFSTLSVWCRRLREDTWWALPRHWKDFFQQLRPLAILEQLDSFSNLLVVVCEASSSARA